MGSIGLGKSHPQNKDELEQIVEWKPVGSTDSTLNNGEESVNNPIRQPLSIINLGGGKERLQGVVSRKHEARKIDEEFSSDIEEDQEKIYPN